MTCDEARQALGGYVLGGLEAAEAAAVEEHLVGCDRCRVVHDELRDLPPLLGLVSAEQAEQVAAAGAAPRPADLTLARLLQRVRAERAADDARRRRRHVVVLAAAAVLLAVALGGGAWAGARWLAPDPGSHTAGPRPSGESSTWSRADPATGVSAEATIQPYGWGVRVDAVMSGMHPGDICLIRVVDSSGKSWDAGSWEVGRRTDDLRWAGDVGVTMERVERVEIWDGAKDRRLVSLSE